jgi:integrase/recombinase XerD
LIGSIGGVMVMPSTPPSMKTNRHGKSRILTQSEYQQLLGVLAPKFRVLLKLCCVSGFRISEALSIRKCDLVGDTIVLRKGDTKGKLETREVPIPPELVMELLALDSDGIYFFSGRDTDRPMTRQNADYALRIACKKLGIEGTSWHGTRRFFINSLHHASVPMKVIQKAVGHRHLASTSRYIDVNEDQVRRAVSLLWQAV